MDTYLGRYLGIWKGCGGVTWHDVEGLKKGMVGGTVA